MPPIRSLCLAALLGAGGIFASSHAIPAVAATTRYVCPPGSSASYATRHNCYPTIQSAIDASGPGDTIVVPGGTYNENLTVPIGVGPLTISGSGTFVDGSNPGGPEPGPLLNVRVDASVSISGFTFTGGDYFEGSGIQNNATLKLVNDHVINNVDGIYGGGITTGGTLTLINTPVRGNTSFYGAGIYASGPVTLSNSPVSGNQATLYGGGIITVGATVQLTNSPLSNNGAAYGAAVYNGFSPYSGTVTLFNSSVTGNQATADGAGIYNNAGMVQLTNGTVANNMASGNGGGFYMNSGTTLSLRNNTVTANSALDGGGIYTGSDGSCSSAPGVTISTSTVSGNTPDECS